MEELYCNFGKRAFAKCLKMKKTMEFKRLSEVVKSHLSHNIKTFERQSHATVAFALDIKNTDTNERLCDFRFTHLEHAKELELWQDCYRIIEDLNTLMKAKKNVNVRILIPYYENLYQIFWHAKEYLFHAVAYQSYYSCMKNSGKDAETIRDASSLLVLSVLSIPNHPKEHTLAPEIYKKNCMLLSSSGDIHTKENLFQMIKSGSYLDLCHKDVRDLFFLMSEDKNMLTFSKQAEKIFSKLKDDDQHKKFLPLIEENLIIQLLKQISSHYRKINFERFNKILGFFDFRTCEKMILYSNVTNEKKVRIDYEKKIFVFDQHNSINLSGNNGVVGLARVTEVLIDNIHQVQVESSGEWNQNYQDSLNECKEYLENAEEFMRIRNETMQYPVEVEVVVKDDTAAEDALEKEKLRQKQQEEFRVRQNQEKTFSVIRERIAMVLSMDNNIILRNKKLKEYNEDDMTRIEIEDLINLEAEIKLKEVEKKRVIVLKQYKKVDFIEREVRKVENKHIETFSSAQTIDIDQLIEEAEKIHVSNIEKRAQLGKTSDYKSNFVTKEKLSKITNHKTELIDFKADLAKDYKEKITKKVIEKCEKILAEKAELDMARRNNMDNKRRFEDKNREDRAMEPAMELVRRGAEFKKVDGTNLNRGNPTMGGDRPAPTGLAKRGEGIIPRGEGLAPSGGGLAPRGEGLAPRGEGLAQRGAGIQRGDGFNKPQGDSFAKPQGDGLVQRGGGLTRGDGLTSGGGLTRGDGLASAGGFTRGDGLTRNEGLTSGGGLMRGDGLKRNEGLTSGGGLTRGEGLTSGGGLTRGDGLQRNTGFTRGDDFKKDDNTTGGGGLMRGSGLGDKSGGFKSSGGGFKNEGMKTEAAPGPGLQRRQVPAGDKKPETKPTGGLQRGAGFKKA